MSQVMRALERSGPLVRVVERPVPAPGPGEIAIRVEVAGLCRTDVLVARGLLPCADPVILGHEFAGRIAALGTGVAGPSVGTPVTVMPLLADGTMLGVHRDGAFAEVVVVPAVAVHPLPPDLPWTVGAYAEPVAAALAATTVGLAPADRIYVLGEGRIAALLLGVLRATGHDRVVAGLTPEPGAWDVVVEAHPAPGMLDQAVRAVRERGRVVLRSRAPLTLTLDLLSAIEREVTLHAVRYGDFGAAVELLVSGRLSLGPLIGPIHPLEAFAQLVDASDAAVKHFLAPR